MNGSATSAPTAPPQSDPRAIVRVVVADDHTLVRQSVVRMINGEQGFRVVADAGRGDEALQLVTAHKPAILLTDVAMPGGTGFDLARKVRAQMPGVRVIFLTVHDDDATVTHAIRIGADGYVLKTSPLEELVHALRAVAGGGSYLSPAVARSVMRRAGGRATAAALTDRELEILRLIADGSRPADVARELTVSPKTVRNHLASIYVKLGVETAAQAIGEAFRRGLVARPF